MRGRAARAKCIVLLAIAPACAWASPARAAESSRLSYVRAAGAEQCPDETALRLAVAVRLGYDPFVAWAKTTIFAQIAREGTRLRARVHLADENGKARGSRELVGPPDDCSKLVAAMSLAISIAIDPMSASPSSAPPPEPVKTSESAPSTPPAPSTAPLRGPEIAPQTAAPVEGGTSRDAAETAPPDDVTSERTWRWFAGAGGVLSTGFAPAIAPGTSGLTSLDVGHVSLGLEGRYDFPVSAESETNRGKVQSKLWLLSVTPCWRFRPLSLCGLGSFGRLQGAGANVAIPLEQTTTYFGIGGRVTYEIPVGDRFSLRAHVDLMGNLTRATLAIAQDVVWSAPLFGAAMGLDAVARVF